VACLLLAPARPALLGAAALALVVFLAANRDLLRFLRRRGGLVFAAAALGLHLLYAFSSGLGLLIGLASCALRPPVRAPGAAR
jgi:hypothetical protein